MQGRAYPQSSSIAVLSIALIVSGCVTPPSWFPFEARQTPRVFVTHIPIVPAAGHSVNIMLYADVVDASDIESAHATLLMDDGTQETKECAALDPKTYQCGFNLDGVPDGTQMRYRGELLLAGDDGVASDATYRFTAVDVTLETPRRLIPIRVPEAPRAALDGTPFALRTVLVADPSSGNFDDEAFRWAAGKLLLLGVFFDPVYRWRSNQLAFYMYTEPATVSDYYSGWDTRCGQNPWPSMSRFPSELETMDAIGVLHAREATAQNASAEIAGGGFRDCAGQIVATKFPPGLARPIASFSARSDEAGDWELAAHEFGHALFGLSDEYNEPTAQRSVQPSVIPRTDVACCCRDAADGGTPVVGVPVGPGIGSSVAASDAAEVALATGALRCRDADGLLQLTSESIVNIAPGTALPDCAQKTADLYPAQCGAEAAPAACPPLRNDCLRDVMWLDPEVPLDAAPLDNIFTSEDACEATRILAQTHPGIEDADAGSLAACIELCGPDSPAGVCACEETARYWRLDRNPLQDEPAGDLMRIVDEDIDHGTACARCVETSLCVRWERARGRSVEQTWEYCEAPPENIVELQRDTVTIVGTVIGWIRQLFGNAKT